MNKIKRYFKGVGEEVRRVRWPSKHSLWSAVLVVLAVTVVSALVLLLCDVISVQILKAFDNAFPDSSSAEEVAALVRVIGGNL